MFVYQFCEIAQMVEYNANGLVQFFGIIKKAYVYILTKGKEFILALYEWIKAKLSSLKQVMQDYFQKDPTQLTKEQLQLQITWTQRFFNAVMVFAAINVVRLMVKMANRRSLKA